jgi:mutator protein MutT
MIKYSGMPELRNSTLVFLVSKREETIERICLAMKKRGFGKGRWNGAGGKVEQGETIEDAAIREVEEEIGVAIKHMDKVAELAFTFPHNPAFDQLVHVYVSDEWSGETKESEEMRPEWFNVEEIPYKEMWADDVFWLPFVVVGEKVRGAFTFAEGDVVEKQSVEVVEEL